MKALLRLLIATCIALGAVNAHAQRAFEQGELDALLAPIALYPDPLLSNVLVASQFPGDLIAAAAWSRANPQLQGDAALRTVDGQPWHPSVKALVAYPEILLRMAESPEWLRDLGQAYAIYGPNVMATVQALRARAQASGYLQSNDQQYVYQQGAAIAVQPAYPNVVYVPYYDPYVVYGPWWTVYRPVFWRPWVPHRVFVTRAFIAPPVRWHVYPRTVQAVPYRAVPESRRAPIINSAPPTYQRIPESQRAPIIQGGPALRSVAPQVRSAPASQPHWAAAHSTNRVGAGFRGTSGGQRGRHNRG
jgi:Protein of unknown function (DUF3300)